MLQFDRFPDSDECFLDCIEGEETRTWISPGPEFTLYGDGTVIFRGGAAELPPAAGSIVRAIPFRIAWLNAGEIQSLLQYALFEGRLGTARELYETGSVDNIPQDDFWVRAGGLDRHVTVLGPPQSGGPDAVERNALFALAEHLANFDAGRSLPAERWAPDRYWAVLPKAGAVPAAAAIAWPWPALTPEGFARRRVMSSVEVAMLGLDDIAGGVMGIHLVGPDGTTVYSLELYPVFPDENLPPLTTPTSELLRVDGLAWVVTDGLRVRSAPGTGAGSRILDERLTTGREVFVIAGPVAADGYAWWQVLALRPNEATQVVSFGWVAAAGLDGEVWLAPTSVACPAAPSIADLARLGGARSLHCYGGRELEVRAFRLPFCGDGNAGNEALVPSWIGYAFGPDLLLDREAYWDDPTALRIYGRAHPSLLNAGTPYFGCGAEGIGWFDVTGHFDDPVSSECRMILEYPDEQPEVDPAWAIAACRQTFVYTELRPAPGPS